MNQFVDSATLHRFPAAQPPLPSPTPPALNDMTAVQRALRDMIAEGSSISRALNAVVCAVAQRRQGETRAAIFILDPDHLTLRFAATDGLAPEYTSKIDHFAIGPGQPSCGKAAFIGHDVIVGDVATDAGWAPFRALADEHGIRACWSFPLKSRDDKVLGTLALYHRVPCQPDPGDYEELGYFAKIASLMISRHLAGKGRQHSTDDGTARRFLP